MSTTNHDAGDEFARPEESRGWLTGLLSVQTLTLVMVLGGGVALSGLAAVSVKRADQSQLERDFHDLADTRGEAIERRFDDDVEILHSIAKLFHASDEVARDEFRTFVRGWLEDRPGIEAFEWIQVGAASTGDSEPSYPVEYAEPHRHAQGVLGLDLAAIRSCRDAMARAADTGRAVTVKSDDPREPADVGTAGSGTVRVIWPVYRGGRSPSTPEERRNTLRGYLAIVLDIDATCRTALADVVRAHDALDTFVLDLDREAGDRLVHSQLTPQRAPGDRQGFDEEAIRAGLHNRLVINLAGRPLEVVCTPTNAFYAVRASWLAWAILAAGMGCSGLLAACISLVDRRARAVDQVNRDLRREVAERRRVQDQLVSAKEDTDTANRQLKQEIAERIHAEHERQRAHEDLQASQAQLFQAAKLESVGRLAAGVAHEVKNPLATLLLGLDFLSSEDTGEDERHRTIVDNMRESIRRADTVIRGLLDFAAPREIDLQPGDVNDVVERSLLLVRGDLLHSHVEVERCYAASLPPVRFDAQKLQQVFVNLFVNACHAMPEGGVITVGTHVEDDERGVPGGHAARVVIRVDDTGTGIPADKLEKIFDPFFTTKPVGLGTGLGLSVSKKIMELHEAAIRYENRPEGGVRVTLTFSALPEREESWTRSESSSSTTK